MGRIVSIGMSVLLVVMSIVASPFAARAAALDILGNTLISATPSGTQGNSDSLNAVMTPDARYVAFTSYATNLTSDTLPAGQPQAFVHDRQNNTTELVSRATNGAVGNQQTYPLGISDNGRFVLLQSSATNFPGFPSPDTLGGTSFIYIRDRQSGTLTRIGDPTFLNAGASVRSMSADGNTVLYAAITSYNWNNGNPQVTYAYNAYNRTTGTSTAIPQECLNAISANGQYATCQTASTLELYNLASGQRTAILPDYVGKAQDIYLNSDATRALFYAPNAANTDYDIYYANLTTGDVTLVDVNPGEVSASFLSMSADNNIVTYEKRAVVNNTAARQAWVANVATGEKLKIVQTGAHIQPITVSADGTEVAYNAAVPTNNDSQQIYVTRFGNSDTAAPTVTGTPDHAPNAAGWYNGNVTIHWTATDPTPSSGAPTQPSDTVASLEGEHTYTSGQGCDPAGNCATGSLTLKIDKTLPTISASQSPAANAAGWTKANTTVTFTCADALSGVQSCSSPVVVGTEGANQNVSGTATDKAGNTATVAKTVKLDKTAPTVSNPTMSNTFFLFGGTASVSANATDALSGVAKGEYYIDADPGQGNGAALTYANGKISGTATIPNNVTFGVHRLYMRSVDAAGNWSPTVSVTFIFI